MLTTNRLWAKCKDFVKKKLSLFSLRGPHLYDSNSTLFMTNF